MTDHPPPGHVNVCEMRGHVVIRHTTIGGERRRIPLTAEAAADLAAELLRSAATLEYPTPGQEGR